MSPFRNNPQSTRHNLYALRIVLGIERREFSEVVPELLRRANYDVLWRCVEITFPVSASAKISLNQSSVPKNCLKKTVRILEIWLEAVAYQIHTTFQGLPENVRMRSMGQSGTDEKFNVCSRHCNLVSDYDVDHWLCFGGC